MSNTIRRTLISRKSKSHRRLDGASRADGGKPVIQASNIHYEVSGRTAAIAHGGIGAMHMLMNKVGLARRIDEKVVVLKQHSPYYESDHVLNIAYNGLCGGQVLEDIELRRNDSTYLDALGAESIPDPTTEGDFCRRFERDDINDLQDAINETRREVWRS